MALITYAPRVIVNCRAVDLLRYVLFLIYLMDIRKNDNTLSNSNYHIISKIIVISKVMSTVVCDHSNEI